MESQQITFQKATYCMASIHKHDFHQLWRGIALSFFVVEQYYGKLLHVSVDVPISVVVSYSLSHLMFHVDTYVFSTKLNFVYIYTYNHDVL